MKLQKLISVTSKGGEFEFFYAPASIDNPEDNWISIMIAAVDAIHLN